MIISMLIELHSKMKAEMKATQNEIKQNIPGTNNEEKETGTQINLDQQKDINIQPEQKEEIRIQKKKTMRRGLGTSGTTLSTPTFKS